MANDYPRETAADLAANAAFILMADELGVSPLLDKGEPFTRDALVEAAQNNAEGVGEFLRALIAAGLVEPVGGEGDSDDNGRFVTSADYAERRYEAGYLTWALNASRPHIENVGEFIADYPTAAAKHQRDGRRVAVSSRWMGSFGAAPVAFAEITGRRPARLVDLGAGSGGLLIELLRRLPDSTAVAVDINAAACDEASRNARRAGMADRLEVVNRSVQSLVEDPTPISGVDLIHAGFVMHDILADTESADAVLRTLRSSLAEGGALVVMDAVPYATEPRERAFSALFTYLHTMAMDVELPTQEQWYAAFEKAGFTSITHTPLRWPAGRMFVVSG